MPYLSEAKGAIWPFGYTWRKYLDKAGVARRPISIKHS